MNFKPIDINTWSRSEYFQHFMNTVRCTYSITANINISKLLEVLEKNNISLYPTMLYILTTIVNRHEEFRTTFNNNGKIGLWDNMSPSYTIFNEQSETFSSIWTEFNKDFFTFNSQCSYDIEKYKKSNTLTPKKNKPQNTFDISMIPWIHFTSFNINVFNEGKHLLPIITLGKYIAQNGQTELPISLQVHHAVCDGFHVSRFINEMQEMCNNYKEWLTI